jgi:hypothetical protein
MEERQNNKHNLIEIESSRLTSITTKINIE